MVETARSRRATLFLISVSGDGGEGFWVSSFFVSDNFSSVGFISTSGMMEYGRDNSIEGDASRAISGRFIFAHVRWFTSSR
jgi:hypothetical protein